MSTQPVVGRKIFALAAITGPLALLVGTLLHPSEAAYRRGDLFEKRRRLMALWAEYCTTAPSGGQVMTLAKGRKAV